MLSVLWRENSFVKLAKLARKTYSFPLVVAEEKKLRFFSRSILEKFLFCKKRGLCNSYRKSVKLSSFHRISLRMNVQFSAVKEKVNLSSLCRRENEKVKLRWLVNLLCSGFCRWQNWWTILTFCFLLHIDRHHEKFIRFWKFWWLNSTIFWHWNARFDQEEQKIKNCYSKNSVRHNSPILVQEISMKE